MRLEWLYALTILFHFTFWGMTPLLPSLAEPDQTLTRKAGESRVTLAY